MANETNCCPECERLKKALDEAKDKLSRIAATDIRCPHCRSTFMAAMPAVELRMYEAQKERDAFAESALATAQARDEEVARLRKALEEISGMGERFDAKGTHSRRVCAIARAALGSQR